MKRPSIVFSSSSPCSPSSSSSSSSPSSSVEFQNPDQTEEGGKDSNKNNNTKRPRNSSENENAKKKSQKRRGRTLTSAAAINGGRRSSIYRGVTRHRWTGRFEAHLWDKSSWNNLQNKKGRQVYLGAYDNEDDAARTYDLAALKYWGRSTTLNFPLETYSKDLEEMEKVTKEEYLSSLRRQSSGFSRGVSKYRGVARHHHNGRWEARIGRVLGNKYLYLGTYSTQEEAAMAYDVAAIQYRGVNAVTNFDISNYMDKINKTTQNSDSQNQQEETLIITATSLSSSHQQEQQVHHFNHSSSYLDSQNLHQEEPQQIEPQNPPIQSSPIAPVDPPPWIFMDDDAFSQFQVPDLPDADLLHMFNDDVDFLFRTSTEEVEFNMDEILNSPTYPDLVMEDSTAAMAVCDNDDDFRPEKLLRSATSPSSSSSECIP